MINLLQFEYMLHEKLLEVFVGEVDTHLFKARTTTATRKLHVANANRSRVSIRGIKDSGQGMEHSRP